MPDVIINGPEGRIEGRYHHARGGTAPMALVLHPHPLHGGTMNNRVVYTMYQTFVRRGFSTLRFNFRGVGRSQGSFDRGEGELADAAAALDWLQTYNPNAASCWVAGYSFGAWIGMQLLMRRPEIEAFISVAPPANSYDFSFLAPCPSSGLILHGDQDSAVPPESVQKLVHKLSHQRDIKIEFRKIAGADHFFADPEPLATHVDSYIAAHPRFAEQRRRLPPPHRAAGVSWERRTPEAASITACGTTRLEDFRAGPVPILSGGRRGSAAHNAATMPNSVMPPKASRTVFSEPTILSLAWASASPASSSIGAQTTADVTLASQNRPRRHAHDSGGERDNRAHRAEEAADEHALAAMPLEEAHAAGEQLRDSA